MRISIKEKAGVASIGFGGENAGARRFENRAGEKARVRRVRLSKKEKAGGVSIGFGGENAARSLPPEEGIGPCGSENKTEKTVM